MRGVVHRGLQGLGIGLAALMLTGLLHLLEPACLIPAPTRAADATALPIGCLPEGPPDLPSSTICTLSTPVSCCLEAHRVSWTSRPAAGTCCQASPPAKALPPIRIAQQTPVHPAALPLIQQRRASTVARYLQLAVLRL
ncbi:MAG: hypothetical protein Q9M35_01845 [Rhodothermus sp.]|nr:hypothetical protein [Rhodothermus sp.]